MLIDHKTYKKAFSEYLKKGTPILWSVKQERITSRYIWRTRWDDKVRSEHARRDGEVFSWDNPPSGGHPGEDHNCRCWAEPVPEADPLPPIKIRNENLIAGPFGKWGPWVEVFDLSDSEMGRGDDGFTVTHEIDLEFNRRGDGPESTFDVEIIGLGQSEWVTGPGSTTITHSYTLSATAELRAPTCHNLTGTLKARSRAHTLTQSVDARITFR